MFFSIICPFQGCPSGYSTFFGIRNHVYRHPERDAGCQETIYESIDNSGIDQGMRFTVNTTDIDMEHDNVSETLNMQNTSSVNLTELSEKEKIFNNLSDNISHFYAYALDILCLPEASVLEMTARVENIVSQFSTDFTNYIKGKENIPSEDLLQFESLPRFSLNRSFFDDYLSSKYDFLNSEEITCSNGDTFSYIPIGHYVVTQFPKEEILCSRNDSYFQSDYFKTKIEPYCNPNSKVVHILLYGDEFETCNPIGVARGKHKLFAIYFKVLNFHPRHNSSIDSIHLVQLIKNTTLKSIGIDKAFETLIEELNDLYFRGLVINDETYYVVANCFSGDNLASNFVGGYSCSFARGKCCRFCNMCASEFCSNFTSMPAINRSHRDIVQASIEGSDGMKFSSPFLNLPYVTLPLFFHPDIMHDIYEGVSHLILCSALKELLRKQIVYLDTVNNIFRSFSLFSPATITVNNINTYHLPFTASQICYWLQFFCSQFACFFNEDEPVWLLLLKHCEIVEFLLYPGNLRDNELYNLKLMIIEQNRMLSDILPGNSRYKCKIHNMLHYTELMKLFGSLTTFSTMRFEALHLYFKQLIRKLKQYVNLPKTLSYRFQRRNAIIKAEIGNKEIKCRLVTPFDINELDFNQRKALLDFLALHDDEAFSDAKTSAHISVDGYDYYCKQRRTIVVFDVDPLDSLVVGLITHIIFLNGKWHTLLERVKCSYEPHFKSYIIVQRLSEYFVQYPLSVLHPPLTCFMLSGYFAFSLKHVIRTGDE